MDFAKMKPFSSERQWPRLIKGLLPEKLRSAEKGLRMAGMGAKLDEFELSMNAAEKAAPAALPEREENSHESNRADHTAAQGNFGEALES